MPRRSAPMSPNGPRARGGRRRTRRNCVHDGRRADPGEPHRDGPRADPANRVHIDRVHCEGPAWVQVFADANGTPSDERLGRARVGNGRHTGVRVDLSRALTDGEAVWTELRTDRGELNAFDEARHRLDTPPALPCVPGRQPRAWKPKIKAWIPLRSSCSSVLPRRLRALSSFGTRRSGLGAGGCRPRRNLLLEVPLGRRIGATGLSTETLTATLYIDRGAGAYSKRPGRTRRSTRARSSPPHLWPRS